jgi:hypothetical protein
MDHTFNKIYKITTLRVALFAYDVLVSFHGRHILRAFQNSELRSGISSSHGAEYEDY